MIDYAIIEDQMRGNWVDFLSQELGEDIKTNKARPCPTCGGDDRAHFREDGGRVYLFCRGACGEHNSQYGSNTCTTPENLILKLKGYSFPEFVNRAAEFLGIQTDRHANYSRNKTAFDEALEKCEQVHAYEVPYLRLNGLLGTVSAKNTNTSDLDRAVDSLAKNYKRGRWLVVPLYRGDRICGLVGIDENGKTKTKGNKRGLFEFNQHTGTPKREPKRIFTTSYGVALKLIQKGHSVLFSPDFKALKMSESLSDVDLFKEFNYPDTRSKGEKAADKATCPATHVFLNTREYKNLRAAAVYFYDPKLKFLIPKDENFLYSGEYDELTRADLEKLLSEFERTVHCA